MEMMDEVMEYDTVTIPGENGVEEEYAIVDRFDFEGNQYVVVSLIEGDMVHDDEAYIFLAKEDEESIELESIPDENEYMRLIEAYDALFED